MDDNGINYIALAIPVFFLAIGIEYLVARHHRREVYRLNDTINDLSTGVLQQLTGVFAKGAIYAGYFFLFERFALLEVSLASPWTWILGFLGVDFCYYWFHRLSHGINVIWASHITHHQSEEYNLSVALRQSATQAFFSAPFYWPLAVIGLPPVPFLALTSFNTLYQFWIHTRIIDRLPKPFELVFNTPSHHRVHHGCNPEYIDRNHGGTLIVWDRLFGTFVDEADEPVYGVTRPIKSWNPLWANLHYYVELFKVSWRTRRWRDKLKIWVMPPAWRPDDVPVVKPAETPLKGYKYDAKATPPAHRYVALQFTVAVMATVALLFFGPKLSGLQQGAIAGYVAWTLVHTGAIFERRGWLAVAEPLRLVALVAAAWGLFGSYGSVGPWIGAGTTAMALASLGWWVVRAAPDRAGSVDGVPGGAA